MSRISISILTRVERFLRAERLRKVEYVIGQLNVVQFDNNQLLNTGGGELDFNSQIYFKLGEATLAPAEDASVLQGYRELSNAHPVTELISLIVGSRGVESAQKAIRAISDAVKENINS